LCVRRRVPVSREASLPAGVLRAAAMGNKFTKSSDSKFTKPTGLYPTCEWDNKTVKKLINKKKVAPRYPGREEPGPELDEGPICFLVR
jgi:hypothetical protein